MRQTDYLTLINGRRIAYTQQGKPGGKPVLFFHGSPGSRLFYHPDESIVERLGIWLISVDRPGFGQSDAVLDRTIRGWAWDVAQLADCLGLHQFALAGHSGGGGPHIGICAVTFPERLTRVAFVSTAGVPLGSFLKGKVITQDRLVLGLARYAPPIFKFITEMGCRWAYKNPDKFVEMLLASSPESDIRILEQPAIRAMVRANFVEAFRSGGIGQAIETMLAIRDWGFAMEDIPVEAHVWHGDQDPTVPLSVAEHLAASLPNSRTFIIPGGGHLIVLSHWEEILSALVA